MRLISLTIFLCVCNYLIYSQNGSSFEEAISLSSSEIFTINELQEQPVLNSNIDCLSDYKNLFGRFGIWLKLNPVSSGDLAFDIIPHSLTDDIDFILFELKEEGEPQSKEIRRCMLEGPVIRGNYWEEGGCLGITGLSLESFNIHSATTGCNLTDNYLSSVSVEEGEVYYLYVNNFNSETGFSIHFTGTAEIVSNTNTLPQFNQSKALSTNIFPNPASDFLLFEYNLRRSENTLQYEILSSIGELIVSRPIDSISPGWNRKEISLQDFPPGTYILRIFNENNFQSHIFIVH